MDEENVGFESAGGPMPDEAPPESATDKLVRWIEAPNIAVELTEEQLGAIGQLVKREVELDERSRDDWKAKVEKAIDLAKQVSKPKNYPWPGASNVVYPLMTTASVQFAARAYPAIIANRTVVKGVVAGRDEGKPLTDPRTGQPVVNPQSGEPVWQIPPGALQARADRVGAHMSWQLLEQMPEWEPETDTLLHQLPIVGTLFRKSFHDGVEKRNKSLLVGALNLIVNYNAKSIPTAPRLTEVVEFYPNEIREFENAGLWLARNFTPDIDRGLDKDAPIVFYEQHRWLDLDEDGYAEPYIVTIDKNGAQVVRITARYDLDGVKLDVGDGTSPPRVSKIDPIHYYTMYTFLPSLDGGIYGTGFGQLLGPINAAVNATLNQLIDAGHLANTSGGFVAKSLSMHSGNLRWTMGEFKPVNVTGTTLKDSVLPLPFAGPNQALFALLGMLVDAGKDVASVKDVLAGEQPQANVPATTVLALIEQGQKVFTAIYKRIHRALKQELTKLYRLNRVHMGAVVEFQVEEQWIRVERDDYVAGAGVRPVSDPAMVSEAQQLGRAQYLMQFRGDPLIKQAELTKRLLKAASIDDVDKLLNLNPPTPPQVAMKGLELQLREREVKVKEYVGKAQSLQALTQGALNLAKADEAVGAAHLAWIDAQMNAMQLEFEQQFMLAQAATEGAANGSGPNGAGGSGPAGATGARPGGVRPMATPSGFQGGAAVPR